MGRTGVFIALSIVLERMRYEGVVDMFQTVKMLRAQRPSMVQNEVRIDVDCSVVYSRPEVLILMTDALIHIVFFGNDDTEEHCKV